jgi:pyruvate/2-oxoglutarate dehydrogenase complex dihydrolipoamide dehydrogenase (E3) component
MTRKALKADMIVIGAGSGGLSVASGAAQLGLKVVLFEKGEMGGDCLNYGCVPSKALIAAADAAHQARSCATLGIDSAPVTVDFTRVMAHVHRAIAAIAPNDSQARFEGLRVRVIRDTAYFLGQRTVATDEVEVSARKIIIATGSRAIVPPIPGLAETPHLTNETIFELKDLPQRLIVLGGGPIGIELGQAFRRLGSRVVIIDAGAMLVREDRQAADVVLGQLASDGVELFQGYRAVRIEVGPSVIIDGPGGERRIDGSHLLVAVGRAPNLEALDLGRGKVACTRQGVTTDAGLRSTTNRHVFAVGDVAGRGQFTHLASAHAALVLRRAVFGLPVDGEALALPRVTYADPELAAIGLSEADARQALGDDLRVEQIAFAENDRAQAEGDIRGFGKLVTTAKGKVLGVTLVGRHAGDHIGAWALAMSAGLKLSKLTGMIAPYPTRGEINKRLAGQWYTPALFSDRTRRLVWLLKHLI